LKTLRLLIPYLKIYRRALVPGVLWLAATNALGLLIPWMLKKGVDAVPLGDYRAIWFFAAVLAAAALLRGGTRVASRLRFLHTARRIEVDIRRDLLARLLVQEASFFDRHRTGDILSRFTNDLANIRTMAGFGVMTLVNTALVYLFTLTLLLILSPSLTAVALFPYPLMLLAVKRLSRSLLHHSTLVQEGLGRISEAAEEGISGQAVIRAGGQAGVRSRRFEELNDDYLQRNLALARLRSLILPIMTLVGPLGTLLVLYFGGNRVAAGNLSLGDLVAFNAYLVMLTWPTLLLGWVLTLMQRAGASMARLETFLNLPLPAGRALPGGLEGAPEVELRGLDFAYGETAVLHGLRFRVPGGRLVGVTGPTASGKTTLLRLLAGLYPLPPEKVFVAGEDLAGLEGDAHRRRLAMVLQEGRLFSGTVRENLLYGVPGASEDLLREVTEKVCLGEEVAAFGEGFDTRVGEGGMTLSGGQRQRVGLGRALAKGGSLWLLDDPFSHLDAATARDIWESLRPLLRNKTVFLVSGRVSLLSAADHILVMEEGRLREQGSHGELLQAGGLYFRLARREKLREELEGLE
jgi:ATP-binding cassette subfamily B multidrug efflux pump